MAVAAGQSYPMPVQPETICNQRSWQPALTPTHTHSSSHAQPHPHLYRNMSGSTSQGFSAVMVPRISSTMRHSSQ